MSKAYKTLKEDFVSNLTGSSLSDIGVVTFIVPVCAQFLLFLPSIYLIPHTPACDLCTDTCQVSVAIYSLLQSKHHLFDRYGPIPFGVDFGLNVGAILLATTLYASNPSLLHVLLIAPALLLWLGPQPPKKRAMKPPQTKTAAKPTSKTAAKEPLNPLPIKPFLTTYRGCMMVITCLAILAVDFKIFPRKFAKVENWGTSLMDLGVGSFVFSAGVVAARPILKERVTGKKTILSSRLYTSIKHSAPLLILGVIRLISVKGLDYAEHTAEYGVHWNFFFTLAFLPPFVAIFQSLFALIPSFELWAVLLAGLYELVLDTTALKGFILTGPRTNLISQNREGIFSFIGYLAIFLAGQGCGTIVIPRNLLPANARVSPWAQRKKLLESLAYTSLAWCAGYVLTTEYHGLNLVVSRRLANLPYLFFVAAFSCIQLTLFCLIETVFFPEVYKAKDAEEEKRVTKNATSRVLKAYNRNGLAIFLVSNLLTGLVNLTVPTLHVTDVQAMGVLLAYSGVLTGLAVGLDAANISIKM